MLSNCGVEKTLKSPLDSKESNQSISPLEGLINQSISPLEGLMLKLKLQYFGHPIWRTDSLEKILMLGKIEGRRRRGWQRMRWLDGITSQWMWVWVNSGSWWWTGKPGMLQSMELQSQTRLSDWTELNTLKSCLVYIDWAGYYTSLFSLVSFDVFPMWLLENAKLQMQFTLHFTG